MKRCEICDEPRHLVDGKCRLCAWLLLACNEEPDEELRECYAHLRAIQLVHKSRAYRTWILWIMETAIHLEESGLTHFGAPSVLLWWLAKQAIRGRWGRGNSGFLGLTSYLAQLQAEREPSRFDGSTGLVS